MFCSVLFFLFLWFPRVLTTKIPQNILDGLNVRIFTNVPQHSKVLLLGMWSKTAILTDTWKHKYWSPRSMIIKSMISKTPLENACTHKCRSVNWLQVEFIISSLMCACTCVWVCMCVWPYIWIYVSVCACTPVWVCTCATCVYVWCVNSISIPQLA